MVQRLRLLGLLSDIFCTNCSQRPDNKLEGKRKIPTYRSLSIAERLPSRPSRRYLCSDGATTMILLNCCGA